MPAAHIAIDQAGSESGLFFHARLSPYRSLGHRGFLILMGSIGALTTVAGTIFYLRGAWPVFGFCGLDLAGLYLAFRINYRRARLRETIRLDRDALVVHRALPNGREQTWRFEPYWVRVQMDDPPRRDSELALVSHGRRLTLGGYLTPGERLEVARGLRAALRTRDGAINPATA